jgi:hypothetical protein|nr:MAG TPA: hypothetical protein [Caudoviricetes sp.]
MTAKEYCKSHPVTAYDSSYGRCGGFQIHGDIEYGIDDYLYGMSGVLCEDEKYFHYHHLKIHETMSGRFYVRCFGKRIYLDECMRV